MEVSPVRANPFFISCQLVCCACRQSVLMFAATPSPPHPPLFVVTTNLPPTLRPWGIHPRPAFYRDPNAPGLCGGLGMCLLQQDQLEREQQQAAGATKKHKMPSKSEKNRSPHKESDDGTLF